MFKEDILYHLLPKKDEWIPNIRLWKKMAKRTQKRIYQNVPSICTLSHSSKNRIFGEYIILGVLVYQAQNLSTERCTPGKHVHRLGLCLIILIKLSKPPTNQSQITIDLNLDLFN